MAFNPPIVDDEIPSAAKWNQAVGVYDRSTTEVDVNTTTVETTIYTKSIGAGHMSTDRLLRLQVIADALFNTGTAQVIVRVKLGATTLLTATQGSITAIASRRSASIDVFIQNLGATNSQVSMLRTPGFGAGASGNILELPYATSAVDTTVANDLVVTVQHDLSSASRSYRKRSAILELL